MWIKHSNGTIVLVHNEDHIKRILGEGGQEIPDPRIAPPESTGSEEGEPSDGSTTSNESEQSDSASQSDDRKPNKRKPTVRRPGPEKEG